MVAPNGSGRRNGSRRTVSGNERHEPEQAAATGSMGRRNGQGKRRNGEWAGAHVSNGSNVHAHGVSLAAGPTSTRDGRSIRAVAPPVEGLNPKYTFENFVIGPSNQLAHAASIAAAGGSGPRHNPLFFVRRNGARQDSSRSCGRPPRSCRAPASAHSLCVCGEVRERVFAGAARPAHE